MKIRFGLSKDLIYWPQDTLKKYSWSYYELTESNPKVTQDKITVILKERFKSVHILIYERGNQSFEFEDRIDEAAFLLWSSGDYVEI